MGRNVGVTACVTTYRPVFEYEYSTASANTRPRSFTTTSMSSIHSSKLPSAMNSLNAVIAESRTR